MLIVVYSWFKLNIGDLTMKVLVNVDPQTLAITTDDGIAHGTFCGVPIEHKDKNIVLDLVKQGVTAEDIIKMKNNDLL